MSTRVERMWIPFKGDRYRLVKDGTALCGYEYSDYGKYDGKYLYLCKNTDEWHAFDKEGAELIPYCFRDDVTERKVSIGYVQMHCTGFRKKPRFNGGYAAAQFVGTERWHVITANGRILFDTGKTEVRVLGNGLFTAKEAGVITVLDTQGRSLFRYPAPGSMVEVIPLDPPFPIQLKNGQWQAGKFKVKNGGMERLMQYLSRFAGAGLHYTGTRSYAAQMENGMHSLTLSFAPSMSEQDCLYMNVESKNGELFFYFSAPAASDVVWPVPYTPDERLYPSRMLIAHSAEIQATNLGGELYAPDAIMDEHIAFGDEDTTESYGDFDDYPLDTTRV